MADQTTRYSRQRNAVQAALSNAGRPLLAQEVLSYAQREIPGLGIATVYRNLKTLVQQGDVLQVVLPGDNPRYEIASLGHHHHFHCVACGQVYDVHACPRNLASLTPDGFVLQRHELTLYGRCRACAGSTQ